MTPESISIREAVRGDLPAILQLYAQPGYDDGRILEEEEAARIFERCSAYPFYRFFIAQKDDEIVGVYGLLIMDNL